jgi:hypothetical protein
MGAMLVCTKASANAPFAAATYTPVSSTVTARCAIKGRPAGSGLRPRNRAGTAAISPPHALPKQTDHNRRSVHDDAKLLIQPVVAGGAAKALDVLAAVALNSKLLA